MSKTDRAFPIRILRTGLLPLIALLLLAAFIPSTGVAAESKEGLHSLISPGPLAADHAKYDGIMNCTKCHRLGGGVPDSYCLDCHDKLNDRIKAGRGLHSNYKEPCAKCHSDHKGRSYKMIVLEEKKFDHDKTEFKLVEKHAKADCAKCHKKKSDYIGTPKTCVGCHKDVHKKQLDQDCSKCHNAQDWKDIKKFNHDRDSQYALTWKHKEVKCAKCHANGKWKPVPFKRCEDCHKDVHKAQFKNQTCESCHTTKDWKEETFDHNGPKYSGYKLDGKHLNTQCDKCHVKGVYKPIKSSACDAPGCHPNPHKKQFEGKKCDSCHITAGWGRDAFDHDDPAYKGYKLEGKHRKVKCEECHQKGVYKPIKHKLCSDCHKDEHKDQFKGQKCEDCHTVRDWKEETFDHNGAKYSGYKLDGKHLKTPCDKCHVKAVYKPIKYRLCEDCHKDEHNGQFKSQTCDSCHTTKDWKEETFGHNSPTYKGYKLDGKHVKTPCDKCHVNGKWKPLPDSCVNCHDKDDTHKKELGNVCDKCHNTTDWKKYQLNHTTQARFPLQGKHKDVKCEKCHPENKKPKQYRTGQLKCQDCHKDVHKGKFKEECQSCHNQYDWVPKRYDHRQKTGYALSGAHEASTCGACHKSADYKITKKSCFQCHTDPHNNQFGRVECSQCHTQASWSPMQFRHTSTRYPLVGSHKAAECRECHKGGNYRNTSAICINCHMTDYTSAPNHAAYGYGTDCASCHAETFKSWYFKHPGGSTGCSACHLTRPTRPSSHVDTTRYPLTCESCHKFPSWSTVTFNHTSSSSCETCHSKDVAGKHNALYPLRYQSTCSTCHKYPVWLPSIFTHSSTSNCASCHMGNEWPSTHKADTVKYPTTCSSCHKYNTWNYSHTSTTNCSSCHLTSPQRPSSHTTYPTTYTNVCENCHTYPVWANASVKHTTITANCSVCHLNDRPTSHTSNPSSYSTTCESCHKYPSWANATVNHSTLTTNCSSCHLSDRPTSHSSNPTSYPTTCESCHKYPSWANATYTHTASTTNCSSCHLSDAPTQHTQYTSRFGTVCQNCHTYPVWSSYKSFSHTFSTFPTNHKGYSRCSDCHPSMNYGNKGGCIECHTSRGAKTHHTSTNSGCLSCHPDGRE